MSHSIMQRILFKASAYLPCRIISGNDGQPYLERYHLLSLPFNVQIYLHRFVASDPGKCLHNHPWKSALSLLISGQYIETRLRKTANDMPFFKRIMRAGHINWIDGSVYHRIDLAPNTQAWSLFIHSKKQESWGFIQHENNALAYQDHDLVVKKHNNAYWWHSAPKPIQQPNMRAPM